jgi:signal transduction histidine kinase
MRIFFGRIPLQWRVFAATSITITLLFAAAGWGLQHYALSVADESIRAEIRASIQSYDAVWKARTRVLSNVTAVMGAMSDVRAALGTRHPETIRDSVQELWSRTSDQSAVFLVLDGAGHLISSLGKNSEDFSAVEIPLQQVADRFPAQLAGYLRQHSKLFYVVLTPVYVQTSGEPILLNVLCAGFRIDDSVAQELKELAPGSDFVFLDPQQVFASSFGKKQTTDAALSQQNQYVVSPQHLRDIRGRPVAELRVLRSYASVEQSLANLRRSLEFTWLATIAIALIISSFATERLLQPIKVLDRAASEIAARNYAYRLPVNGSGELSRLAATFNGMCDSIQEAQAELIHQEQLQTIGRLATSLVHDLRNPLAAIYGGAEMLVDHNMPADQTQRIASNIHRACIRVQNLLGDLLDVARGEAQRAENCRLRDIVEAAAENADAPNRNVKVKIGVDHSSELFVDRTRVERVFTNLLSNAVEAMPDGGDIFIYSKIESDHVKVFVEDTGPGVPRELRAQLFRPFVTGKRSGLGIGLSLARQTMRDLGGDLQFVQRSGPGACFYLRFPRKTSAEQNADGTPGPETDSAMSEKTATTKSAMANMGATQRD